MKKLYMIGIDAVPLWILEQLRKEKGLGIFDKMLKDGTIVDMESTLPPMTGPAWPTIYTGLKPGEHGVPDFFTMSRDYTPDLAFYDSYSVPPFWKKLAEDGKKCLLITPATDITLPDYANVDMITGFPLPAKSNTKELRSLMKKYKFKGEPDIEADIKSGKMSIDEAVREFIRSIRARVSIAKEMMAQKDYDFIYVCFTETDRIQHFIMGEKNMKEHILPIYAELASFVDDIAKSAEKEGSLMIVVSDHGMQPIKGKFLINSWMVNNGYARFKESFANSMKGSGKEGSISYSVREKLLKTKLRKVYDKMPHQVKRATFKMMGSAFSGSASGEYVRMHLFDLDMGVTKAFAAIANEPVSTIWINDERFSSPTVSKKDKDKLKSELISGLKKVKTPEGEQLIVDVIDGDSYYGKTKKFMAPDLFIEARKGYTIDLFYYSTSTNFMRPEGAKSGDHLRSGIFGYYPKTFKIDTKGMNVADVMPTVLRYFNSG